MQIYRTHNYLIHLIGRNSFSKYNFLKSIFIAESTFVKVIDMMLILKQPYRSSITRHIDIDVTIERVTMIYITYDLRETRPLVPHIMKHG